MSSLGHEVIGIDVDAEKVSGLNAGLSPFYEPGLDELLAEQISSGRLKFSTDMADAAGAKVHFVAVGTPQAHGSLSADLSYLESVIDSLLPRLESGDLVVGKSTVPVGTARRLSRHVRANSKAHLAWNPEFLREGHAIKDTVSPDRLVYGLPKKDFGKKSASRAMQDALSELYHPLLANGVPLVVTDYETAELVKVSANAFLATKISFINAMAEVCEAAGGDVTQLAEALGYDARIGNKFLGAGLGFGGGCLPKDIRGFIARAEELGAGRSVAFLHEVDRINLRRRARTVELAERACAGVLEGKKIAVLGLAFKPNSDDVRDSPALDVASTLHTKGARVRSHDPKAVFNAKKRFPRLKFARSAEDAIKDADAVLVLTEWKEYRNLDPVAAAKLVKTPVVIDGRNCLDPAQWRAAGWTYHGLGR